MAEIVADPLAERRQELEEAKKAAAKAQAEAAKQGESGSVKGTAFLRHRTRPDRRRHRGL